MNEGRAFKRNLKALGLAQGVNFLYPLLALPIVGRGLGASSFGVLMSCYAVVLMASTVVDYGFNFEGPRLAAERKNNNYALAELYFSILAVKLCIATILAIIVILYGIAFSRGGYEAYAILPLITLPTLFGAAVNPQWLLLSVGNPSPFVYTNALVRFVCFGLYLYYDSGNMLAAGLALTAPVFIASLISQFFVPFGISGFRRKISIDLAKKAFRSATPIFVSNVATLPYTQGGPLLLSYFHGAVAAGLYAAADRLIRPILSIQGVFFQAAYPLACRGSRQMEVARKPLIMAYVVTALSMLGVCFFADKIVFAVYSAEFSQSAEVLRLIGVVLLLSPLAMASAQIWLIAMGHGSKASKIYLFSSVCYCVVGPMLIFQYSCIGAASSLLGAEVVSTILLLYFARTVIYE